MNIWDLFLILFPEAALFLLIRKLQCVDKIYKVTGNLVKCSHSPFTMWSFVLCTLLKYLWPFKQQGWNNFIYLKCFRQHMCGQTQTLMYKFFCFELWSILGMAIKPWWLWYCLWKVFKSEIFQMHASNISMGTDKTLFSLFLVPSTLWEWGC